MPWKAKQLHVGAEAVRKTNLPWSVNKKGGGGEKTNQPHKKKKDYTFPWSSTQKQTNKQQPKKKKTQTKPPSGNAGHGTKIQETEVSIINGKKFFFLLLLSFQCITVKENKTSYVFLSRITLSSSSLDQTDFQTLKTFNTFQKDFWANLAYQKKIKLRWLAWDISMTRK